MKLWESTRSQFNCLSCSRSLAYLLLLPPTSCARVNRLNQVYMRQPPGGRLVGGCPSVSFLFRAPIVSRGFVCLNHEIKEVSSSAHLCPPLAADKMWPLFSDHTADFSPRANKSLVGQVGRVAQQHPPFSPERRRRRRYPAAPAPVTSKRVKWNRIGVSQAKGDIIIGK